jgi:hypothetical protein
MVKVYLLCRLLPLLLTALYAGVSPAHADCDYRERKDLTLVGLSPDDRSVFLAFYSEWVPVHTFDAVILSLGPQLPPTEVSPCGGAWYARWPGDSPTNPQEPSTVYPDDDKKLNLADIDAFYHAESADSAVAASLDDKGRKLTLKEMSYEIYSGLETYVTRTFAWDARASSYTLKSTKTTDSVTQGIRAAKAAMARDDAAGLLEELGALEQWGGRASYAVTEVPEELRVPLWTFMARLSGKLADRGEDAGAASFVEKILATADTLSGAPSSGGDPGGGRRGKLFIAYSLSPETEKSVRACLNILRRGGKAELARNLAKEAGLSGF